MSNRLRALYLGLATATTMITPAFAVDLTVICRCVVGGVNSETATWTVQATNNGAPVTLSCNFLFMCTGYYNYDAGYTPDPVADPVTRSRRRGRLARLAALPVLAVVLAAGAAVRFAGSRHAPKIAAVRGAHRRHGGGGSLYLILRRR